MFYKQHFLFSEFLDISSDDMILNCQQYLQTGCLTIASIGHDNEHKTVTIILNFQN